MWINGWDSIDKMNIKETRELQRERLDRKKKVQAVILQRVQQMKDDANNVVVDKEAPPELESDYSNYLQKLYPRMYRS